jgi:hypothetical protein
MVRGILHKLSFKVIYCQIAVLLGFADLFPIADLRSIEKPDSPRPRTDDIINLTFSFVRIRRKIGA